jgi:hypothetical protein
MRILPNSLSAQPLPTKPKEVSGGVRAVSAWLALWVTCCFAYLGISTICRLIWPGDKTLTELITWAIFLAWMYLISKLGIIPMSGLRYTARLYSVAAILTVSVCFSVSMVLLNIWNQTYRGRESIESAAVAGLLYAGLMVFYARHPESSASAEKVSPSAP